MFEITLPTTLYIHLALNMLSATLLVVGIYRRFRPGGGAIFTLVMLNIVTFCLTTLLSSVSIDLGVSLGLFAIFGILRYRTSALEIGDLTYVFIVIGIAVINGISIQSIALGDVLLLNALILAAAASLELLQRQTQLESVKLRYDRIDLIVPSKRAELLADLSERLGSQCATVTIRSVNMLMSTAELTVEFESTDDAESAFSSRPHSSFSPLTGSDTGQ